MFSPIQTVGFQRTHHKNMFKISRILISMLCLKFIHLVNLKDFLRQLNRSSGFSTRSDTNLSVQSEKRARNLRFCILEDNGLYLLCRENKGADQLCS